MPNRTRGAQRFPVMNNNLQLGYRGVKTLLIYINNEIYIAGTPVLYETNEQELPVEQKNRLNSLFPCMN